MLAREVGGEMILLDLDLGNYYGLNEVGCRVWSLLVAKATFGEIEERLFDEFEVDRSTLASDLRRVLRDLAEHGLIDVLPDDSVAV